MVVHRLHVLCLVVGCFVLAFSASASADQNYDRKLERVFAKANPNITNDHMKGLRQLRIDHDDVGRRIVVSLDPRPRRTED